MSSDETRAFAEDPNDPVPEVDPGIDPGIDETFAQIWDRIIDEMPPANKAWLQASVPVSLQGTNGLVAVPDDFTRGRLEGRLRVMLEDLLAKTVGRQVRLVFDVDPKTCRRHAPAGDGSLGSS